MGQKILLISTCKEKMQELEFVKPIENILGAEGKEFFTKSYLEVSKKDLNGARGVIICGTSLKDNAFLDNFDKFSWIADFDKPLLGICAGMQIILKIFGGRLKNKTEIGFFVEDFKKNFLGLGGKQEVYHLHNNYMTLPRDFEDFTSSDIPQAVKHKSKPFYGVLFHPEVRQKNLILNFSNL